jgi:hypothetical protein
MYPMNFRLFKISFWFFVAVGCSSQKTAFSRLYKDLPFSTIKTIPVQSKAHARELIFMRWRFAKLLFEQVHPVAESRRPLWSKACLESNIVGEVQEKDGNITWVSVLYKNPKGAPGFCPNEFARQFFVVLTYCASLDKLIELTTSPEWVKNLKEIDVCR